MNTESRDIQHTLPGSLPIRSESVPFQSSVTRESSPESAGKSFNFGLVKIVYIQIAGLLKFNLFSNKFKLIQNTKYYWILSTILMFCFLFL